MCFKLLHYLDDIVLVSSCDCMMTNAPFLDNMKTRCRFKMRSDNNSEDNKTRALFRIMKEEISFLANTNMMMDSFTTIQTHFVNRNWR